ncbi:MAG TPA: efflux RND transporter periplasmic adaptor subunit [Gammaproteobacteria bacterium]|nr:efflux RND transporter periplasmic adaptor subunit [Gammaproteobacteria bacterium]
MKRSSRPSSATLLLAALAMPLGFAAPASTASAQTSPKDAPAAVRVVAPQRRDFELSSTQPGTAEAFYEADLGAKVSGYVSELDVDVGDRVAAKQVLARIAVPELVESRNAAAADVKALQSEYERIRQLAENKSATERTATEAKNRLDAAVAKQAEIEAELDYATIEAPFAGIVTWRAIDPGDMVYQASSPKGSGQPLLRVAKVDVIRVRTYVPERESAHVDAGDPAAIVFDALPGKSFSGKVSRLSGSLDPATRTMLVEVDLPNADGLIRPGYYGQTRILLESRPQALALPSAAVHTDASGGGAYVYVVAGGSARRLPVVTGLTDGDFIEIRSGLEDTARVAAGATALTDGEQVRVVE